MKRTEETRDGKRRKGQCLKEATSSSTTYPGIRSLMGGRYVAVSEKYCTARNAHFCWEDSNIP